MIVFSSKIIKLNLGQNTPIQYFNLSSYYNSKNNLMIDVSQLMPSNELLSKTECLNDLESQEFDNLYANEIMSIDSKFQAFISIINFVYSYPNGIAIVLIEESPFRDAIKESLIKFIQCRYGYPCYSIEDENDIDYILNECRSSDFNGIDSVFNLTDDFMRYMERFQNGYQNE